MEVKIVVDWSNPDFSLRTIALDEIASPKLHGFDDETTDAVSPSRPVATPGLPTVIVSDGSR